MKRIAWTLAVLLPLGAVLALWWTPLAAVAPAPPAAVASAPAPAPAEPPPLAPRAPEEPEPVAAAPPEAAPPEPLPLPEDVPPEKRAFIESHPELRERARQHALAPAADARWEEAVARGGYTPQDLDPAVRRTFRALTLEPRYAEGGRIDGLVIEEMADDHPFAKAGLRKGDRIDRLQGTPLRDPAELPSLLAHLGPRLDLCALRDGAELCREIVLE